MSTPFKYECVNSMVVFSHQDLHEEFHVTWYIHPVLNLRKMFCLVNLSCLSAVNVKMSKYQVLGEASKYIVRGGNQVG